MGGSGREWTAEKGHRFAGGNAPLPPASGDTDEIDSPDETEVAETIKATLPPAPTGGGSVAQGAITTIG